jgi:hypothetical protein
MLTTMNRRTTHVRGKTPRKPGAPRRLTVEWLEQRRMLSMASGLLAQVSAENNVPPAAFAKQPLALADLPAAAQHSIVAAIGEEAKLTSSNGEMDDYFGNAVAISGNTIVVGDSYATVDGNRATGQAWEGAAYVFTKPGSGWTNMTEVAELTASDGSSLVNFGDAVAINGNTIVVGAQAAGVGGNAYQGAAYVYTQPAGGWTSMTQTAKLTASDGAAGD